MLTEAGQREVGPLGLPSGCSLEANVPEVKADVIFCCLIRVDPIVYAWSGHCACLATQCLIGAAGHGALGL